MTPRALPCLLLPAAIAATAAIAWFSGNAAQPSAATGQLTGFCTPSPAHLEHASVDPAAMQVLTDRVPASSAPMVTERTVVATDADAAWTELPRLPNDMVRDTVRRPQAVLASTLFRSPAFNPRDMPLATNDRDAIAAVVAARIAGAEAAAAEYESALAVKTSDVRHPVHASF